MRTIISIQHIEFFIGLDKKKHSRTYAIVTDKLGNHEEAVGYGKDFKIGDSVQYFHHENWNVNKMQKRRG